MQRDPTAFTIALIDDPRAAVRAVARVALAVLSAAAGLLAVAALEPLLGRPHYFPAFASIVLTAVLAGGGYGTLTTVVFAAGYARFFLDPPGAFHAENPSQLLALVAYSITGWFVSVVGGALRSAYARVREQHVALDRVHRQREDLLRALTHDVRSPLGVIATNAELLARTAGQADPVVERRARLIGTSVRAIDAMLRDLVETVALESGRLTLRRSDIEVPAMLATLKERLAGTLPVERVEVSVADDLPCLRADPERLERVLVNLVSNALKYSPGAVTVGARRRGAEVLLSVCDEGPGIAPADLPRIFDKYFRADATCGGQEGLGLGLYISRLLVEAHGGTIWAESEPGRGTAFHVALPAATVDLAREPAPHPAV